MAKKRILSLVMVLSIIISVFAVSAVSGSAATKPAAPSISLSNKSNGIRVEWKPVSGAAKYRVYYKPSNQSYWNHTDTSNTYYPHLNVKSGTLYYFQVQGIDKKGAMGSYSIVKSLTFIGVPGLSGRFDNQQRNYIYWNPIRGANGYEVVRFYNGKKYGTVYIGKNNYFYESWDGPLLGAHTYQIRAKYNAGKNGTAYSTWSKAYKFNWVLPPAEAEKLTFKFLSNTGMNRAAVCGIMGIIYNDTLFNQKYYTTEFTTPDTDFRYGGISMWWLGTGFVQACPNWKISLTPQLRYLVKDMKDKGVYNKIVNQQNSKNGVIKVVENHVKLYFRSAYPNDISKDKECALMMWNKYSTK